QVTIDLSSTEFDPYLIVIDANEAVIAQEDDSPGAGLNVRLTVTLPSSGQFTAIVTSALPGETGGYSLSLSAPGQVGMGAAVGKQVPPAHQAAQPPAPAAPQPPIAPTPPAQPDAPSQPLPPTRPRTVTGTVVDTQGRPIAGARVLIVPALTTGSVEVRSDANGIYVAEGLLDVPYRARAWVFVDHGGQRVCLRLGMESAVDFDTFVPTQGAVRNFRMQLTGPIEDLRDTPEQFGAVLSVYDAWPYEDAGYRIEFTFTPTGPLIDGTWSEPFTRVVDPDGDTVIRGLPIGPYRVGATLVAADGTRSPLGVAVDSISAPSATIDVDWTGDGSCSLGSGVEWENIYLELP
ncbi:MAG: carboxypeptidase regulatory-like domain-containing protein, partial [Rhodococcus sp.]|nr:carboxypeptidase regulatory-like domain-containing protein [Rhodococcus sp. (in: high G+C Gram-positive bacteria)]